MVETAGSSKELIFHHQPVRGFRAFAFMRKKIPPRPFSYGKRQWGIHQFNHIHSWICLFLFLGMLLKHSFMFYQMRVDVTYQSINIDPRLRLLEEYY